jgi:hypothetical protein
VKKLYKPSRLQRLVAKTDRLIPSADPAYLLSDVQLDAWEAQLMPKVDGNRTVEELVKLSRKAPEIVWALMVALLSLRIMEKRG